METTKSGWQLKEITRHGGTVGTHADYQLIDGDGRQIATLWAVDNRTARLIAEAPRVFEALLDARAALVTIGGRSEGFERTVAIGTAGDLGRLADDIEGEPSGNPG